MRGPRLIHLVVLGLSFAACGDPVQSHPKADATTAPDAVAETGTRQHSEMTASCSPMDRFSAIDEGMAIHTGMLPGTEPGHTIADNTSYLQDDGTVRLYFIAQQTEPLANGDHGAVRSAVSSDGRVFVPEDGVRMEGKYGHPKLLQATTTSLFMVHLLFSGLGVATSNDGLTFEVDDIERLGAAEAGVDRLGGMSVVSLPDGGYRGYFSDLGIPGVPPGPTQLKSATSPDMLDWSMDSGTRIGENAPHLTSWSRQPYALQRAGTCVTLFYQRVDSLPTRLYSATAPDGLTFETETMVSVEGFDGAMAGANVQALADGTALFYYDAQDADNQNHIRVARLTLHPGAD